MKPKDHFNSIAYLYDGFKKRNLLYYNTLEKAIKKEITIKQPVILDIGCATGTILNYLNPSKGIGVDISPIMLKIAMSKYNSNSHLSFKVHDIETSPIKGTFDYILFNDVIEHLINKEEAIKNIAKSMNKNTTLLLSMANPAWEPLLLILEKLNLKMPEGQHQRISEQELFVLFKKYHLWVLRKQMYLPHTSLLFLQQFSLMYVYIIKKTRTNL